MKNRPRRRLNNKSKKSVSRPGDEVRCYAKRKSLSFPTHPKHLANVRQVINKLWHAARLPAKDGQLVVLAVDEALTSIIRHAVEMKRPGNIDIILDINDVRFQALIKDSTNGVDVSLLSKPEGQRLLEKERRYQLGIYLICALMDEVDYAYKKGYQNELKLVKFIG
ncbi:MAG: ATP-binding protein [Planctomycetes bacterium]|nr:ATP-binding protein [Planctomycetota bacterium]